MAQSIDRGGTCRRQRSPSADSRRGDDQDDARRDRASATAGAGMGSDPGALRAPVQQRLVTCYRAAFGGSTTTTGRLVPTSRLFILLRISSAMTCASRASLITVGRMN